MVCSNGTATERYPGQTEDIVGITRSENETYVTDFSGLLPWDKSLSAE